MVGGINLLTIEEFEKAFFCEGLLRKKTVRGTALSLTRIFIKILSLQGANNAEIGRILNRGRAVIGYHLLNTSPIEVKYAEKFIKNKKFRYDGGLGNY